MQVPPMMMTPRMKLHEGEEVLHKTDAFRRKGALGNLHGQIYVTNERVAFVKAIMKSGLISWAADKMGFKPKVEFPLAALARVETQDHKEGPRLLLADGSREETFVVGELDDLIALINSTRASAG